MTMKHIKRPRSSKAKKHLMQTFAIAAILAAGLAGSASVILGAGSAHANGIIRLKDDGASRVQQVQLGLNKSIVVDMPRDAHDLLVASPQVADAIIRTKRRIYIFGKSVGETNIFVFDRSGNPIVSMNLDVERDIAGLTEQLKRFIPGSDIKVELINDNIILTGSVQTPQDAARAAALAQAFVKGGEATTNQFQSSGGGSSSSGGTSINISNSDEPQTLHDCEVRFTCRSYVDACKQRDKLSRKAAMHCTFRQVIYVYF